MCGIAGVISAERQRPDRAVLGAMGDALAHRGPDDATETVWGRAGFSFRRLSIIDVAGGSQPFDDCSGTRHVILNGEIYNHRELRAELEGRGHRLKSLSDVEVVVHGYEEWGDAIVAKLHGMFALAVWDESQQRLLLARDRLGQKPLVYHEGADGISFASELRALLEDRSITPAIHHYLSLQYVPAPLTAFEGVRKLPPGHLLVWERGRARVEPYWTLPFSPERELSDVDAAAEVRRLLRDAVKARLMSDVPLGAFLSGGIDSSAVVALMAEFGDVKRSRSASRRRSSASFSTRGSSRSDTTPSITSSWFVRMRRRCSRSSSSTTGGRSRIPRRCRLTTYRRSPLNT